MVEFIDPIIDNIGDMLTIQRVDFKQNLKKISPCDKKPAQKPAMERSST